MAIYPPAARTRSVNRIRKADDAEHFARVINLCRAHLRVYPDDAARWAVLGRTLCTFARYREAEAALSKALAVAPVERRHMVYWQFGHLEEARGNLVLAMQWHRRAARLQPDNASSWIFCGGIAFRQGRLKQFEAFNRRALKCKKVAFEEAWFNLGGALVAQDRLEEARECYLKAITLDPKYGIAKKRLKDVELAIAERGQTAPKPSRPRKLQRAAAKTPANAVRARTRAR
jgi:tetratricopeptide (TPR) repeat protein